MYLVLLHGHGTSAALGVDSGAPTVCMPRTKSSENPSASHTLAPTRVMMCMLATA